MTDRPARGSYKGVLAYLILTFGIAWSLWEWLLPSSAANLQLFQIYVLPGAFAPAAACFIVRKWITREGFADAGLKLNLAKWRWYLFAWVLPFGVLAFIVCEAVAFGIAQPDFSMTQTLAQLTHHAKISPVIAAYQRYLIPSSEVLSALLVAPLLFGEEFGWRGYLQLRLFPGRPTLAAIGTGIIWGLWHLPLILRGYEFPGNRWISTAVFCGSTILLSIIFGWLRRKSGSVWVTSLAHAATNAIGGSLAVLWFANHSKLLFVGYLGILSWIPLGLLSLWIVLRDSGRAPAKEAPAGA